ncbi:S-adenosyl-L-methionine dependent methyltransferase [Ganoderma leucocontextum]|nr:S-adenosyl-L-methionine dependent methyltransferase [Ganoderma leucocontextum]
MHARNPYRDPPDFQVLAEAYLPLQKHIIATAKGATIDFKNEGSQRRLTEAILHRDFGLKLDLPPDRLCPPVPNRLNYILWLEDIMDAYSLAQPNNPLRVVRGLDIGTGASAIYPLLGCSTHPNWVFSATEIDDTSMEYARTNVAANELEDRISVVPADPSGIFFPLAQTDLEYDFTMCNPPFYSSREDVAQSADAKELGPNAICTGGDMEMITPGGETAFVGRMVEESLVLRHKCRWYTSMLGKMSSLANIVQTLRENKVDNYAISELVQGQTKRWLIAWSFGEIRLPDASVSPLYVVGGALTIPKRIARLPYSGIQNLMPPRNTLKQRLPQTANATQLAPVLSATIGSTDGVIVHNPAQDPSILDMIVSAYENTWSRAARRKRKEVVQIDPAVLGETRMTCRIRYEREEAGAHETIVTDYLVLHWVKGIDRGLFESFASHVERKVVDALKNDIH